MSSNGQHTPASSNPWVQNLIMPAILAIVVAMAGFLWGLNSSVAVLNDRQLRDAKDKDDMKQDINQIKLDIRDLRDRSIREERLQTQKSTL
jgi:hypothetical protein